MPRNAELTLQTAPVELTDLVQLRCLDLNDLTVVDIFVQFYVTRYYTEYQWLLDFSCYSLFTYILSELYISVLPVKAATEVIDLARTCAFLFNLHDIGEPLSGVGGARPDLHLQATAIAQWPLF